MNQNLLQGGHKNTQGTWYSEIFQLQVFQHIKNFDFAILESLATAIIDTATEFSGSASLKSIGCFIQNNCQEMKKMTPGALDATYRLLPLKSEYKSSTTAAEEVLPEMRLSLLFGLCEVENIPVDHETGKHLRPFIYVTPYTHSTKCSDEPEVKTQQAHDKRDQPISNDLKPKVFLYTMRTDLSWLKSSFVELRSQFLHDTAQNLLGVHQRLNEDTAQVHLALCDALRKVLSNAEPSALRGLKKESAARQPPDSILKASDKAQLRAGITVLKENIYSGHCYLANLCTSVSLPNSTLAEDIKHFLTRYFINPSRFGWYLPGQSLRVESYSPERFVSIHGDEIVTEPIKGTVKVSTNTSVTDVEYSRLNELAAQKLWDSKKERAEQHLVVDLLRNDLAGICEPGSVKISALFEIRFDNGLGQMSSVISGRLKSNFVFATQLQGILPAGSVTGTPKKRVVEIIEEIEPAHRRFYCGVCFDVRDHDDIDGTLLIRSLFTERSSDGLQQLTYAGAGAGITALSDPEDEISEIEAKLSSFLKRCYDR